MKRIIHLFICLSIILLSCQKEDEGFEALIEKTANNSDKVDICHNGNTININLVSVEDHLNHGDKLGPCSDDPNVSYTLVPDDNFEQALIDLGYDDELDNLVLTSNIVDITTLRIRNKNISDLTGIEDFENLEVLDFGFNQVTSLDVSNNSKLEWLYGRFNQLVTLDLSNNDQLFFLVVANNNLESLNIKNSNNGNITLLHAYSNPNLSCIEVDSSWFSNTTSNTNVDSTTSFSERCGYTNIPDNNFEQALIDLGYDDELDNYVKTSNINTVTNIQVRNKNISDLTGIEDFENLEVLDFGFNQVTSLDVSNNSKLEWLYGRFNQLVTLDLSNNDQLNFLVVANNNLESLNIKNSNNGNITLLHAYSNPNLVCIEVDSSWFSNTTSNTNVNSTTSFSENCGS